MAVVTDTAIVVLLCIAAVTDVRARIIPNALVAAVAACALARAGLAGFLFAPYHLALVFALFAACVGLFALGAVGGGDAKLIPALALGLPGDVWPGFLLATALTGGVLALAMLSARLVGGRQASPRVVGESPSAAAAESGRETEAGVPYAVAIAAGGMLALWLSA